MSESQGSTQPSSGPSRKVIVRRRQFVAGGGAFVLGVAAVAIGAAVGGAQGTEGGATPTSTPAGDPTTAPPATADAARPSPAGEQTAEAVAPDFDLTAFSNDDPSSSWVVCNKLRALDPVDYEPADLTYPAVTYVNRQPMRAETADALTQLFDAASSEAGLSLSVQSAYRSYDTQVSVYDGWVDSLGQAGADATSARPGFSEHQTGWAVDVVGSSGECALEMCFGETAEGEWVAANAYRFGFLVRYQEDKTPITGYEYEPYHLRYVGPRLSQHMKDIDVRTLEELFGLPAAPDYAA